jgi:hypothetical protein
VTFFLRQLLARLRAFSLQSSELSLDPASLLVCERYGVALRSPPGNRDANGAI